mgnify:CR=1 FL=1
MPINNKLLPLESAYHWEKEKPNQVYMIQPISPDRVIEYTWGETVKQARSMASHLRSLQLESNSKIAIISKNCAYFIMSDLAIWMAGHVSIAVYPSSDADTIGYTLAHSDSKLAFVGDLDNWDTTKKAILEKLPIISYPLSSALNGQQWDDIVKRTSPISDNPVRKKDDLAVLIYTSGSTGLPKGVMHSFGNMAVQAAVTTKLIRNTGISRSPCDHRMLSYLPLAHAFERGCVEIASIQNGFRIYFGYNLETFIDDLKRAKPTIFISVPRLWLKFQLGVFSQISEDQLGLLLKIPGIASILKRRVLKSLGLDSVEIAISGSAPISESLLNWYRKLGLELLEGYAQSENFNYSHLSLPDCNKVGYVGRPLPGVKVRIGEDGEILVKSPANMLGYYKDIRQTQATFTNDGYIKTGDKGIVDDDGNLRITGRLKEIFKTSKGEYVSPAVIENKLNEDPLIAMSCVTGSGMSQPYALVVLAEESFGKLNRDNLKILIKNKLEKLIERINNSVSSHEELQFIAIVKDSWSIENGFLTPTLKIKRSVIENAYSDSIDDWISSGTLIHWR